LPEETRYSAKTIKNPVSLIEAGFVCVDAVSTAEKLNKLPMFSRINPLLQHPHHLR
jgi:hypothetical protein